MKKEKNMTNIYDQTYEMEINELQDMLVDLQNQLIGMYSIKEDIWRYHPANENFINPIKEYDDLVPTYLEIPLY